MYIKLDYFYFSAFDLKIKATEYSSIFHLYPGINMFGEITKF